MGLDIQFYKTKKQDWKEYQRNENPATDDGTLSLLEVAYFRKVNFLVRYFNYEENLSLIEIDKQQIEDLIDICKEVLETNDEIVSNTLLPTQCGFFFGSTEYDKYYYDNVKDVLEEFTNILKNLKDDEVILMQCWW